MLVVDDDLDMLDLLVLALRRAGAEVRSARSAAEARIEVYAQTPHLVITDLAMPLENGLCVLRDVQALRPLANHPVRAILLTAHADPETRRTAEGLGFDLVLGKPMEPSDVVRQIANILGRRT
jgi:two-component system, chemotaxis family, CheB/CheR fusion protein